MTGDLVVVGSLNQDLVTRVAAAPGPGQTVRGSDLERSAGGKGLNQAGAAGRLGRHTRAHMVGRVGDDPFGTSLRDALAASGVDVGAVVVSAGRPSGVALIFVEPDGQNRIVVSGGANDDLAPEDVDRALARFAEPPAALLLQLESPVAAVHAAALRARGRGTPVILDPAPVPEALPESLLREVDLLTPNESEALALLGARGHDVALADAPAIAARLAQERGAALVVLKLGPKGAWVHGDGAGVHVRSPEVTVVDTTAAGDTFNGALAVMLAERGFGAAEPRARRSIVAEAAAFACCAAALSVTRRGALESVPRRDEVDGLWARTRRV